MPLLENFEDQGNYLFKKRGLFPFVIIVPGLIITYYTKAELFYTFQTSWHQLYELCCLLICFIGFLIRAITVGYTPRGTSGRNTDKQIAEQLNTTGLYSIVRHPLYLGNYLMWLGICLRTFNFTFTLIVSLFFWVYYERIMFAEEQFLRKKYGDKYLRWASATPTFFPALKLWQKPPMTISIKKILRQEKNGFFVIFFMFFILELIGEWELNTVLSSEWYWMVGLIFSLVFYIVLKYLKYRTVLLNETNL